MHRIDGANHLNNTFTEGDPALGQLPTVVTDDWLNAIQAEIANVIEATGTTLVKADNTQLLDALAPVVSTMAALRAITPASGQRMITKCYATDGDGGGGNWRGVTGASAATYTHNGGTIIVPSGGDGSAAWLREYSGAVNVKWFGAVGDGVTDDTAAIQLALSSAAGSVYFRSGTYLTSAYLELTTSKILFGDGRSKSIIQQATNHDLLRVTSVSAGFTIRDLEFKNTLASASVTSGAALSLTDASWGVLENLYINNTYDGIKVNHSPILRAFAVDIQFFKNAGWYFYGDLNFDAYIYGSIIDGQLAATVNGLYSVYMTDMCDEIIFDECVLNFASYNLYTTATSSTGGHHPEYCKFNSCSFDSSTNGVLINKCDDITFSNCWFSNRGNGAVVGGNDADGVSFVGCTFANCNQHGLLINTGAVRTTVSACKFVGNSVSANNTYHGIVVADTVTDFTITDSIFTNGWDFSGVQGWGVVINGTTHDRYVITNNNFTGIGAGGGLSDSTTGSPVKYIKNNIGHKTENSGTGTILSGTTSLAVTHGLAVTPVAKDIYIGFTESSSNDPGNVWVSSITSTEFTVNVRNDPGASNLDFTWAVDVH